MTRSVWEKVITDANGVAQPTASIEVRDASTNNLAAIYDALSGGSAKTNPFTVDAAGYAKFYVDPGIYNIKATVGADVKQLDNVEIGMNRRDLNLTDVESALAARSAIGASEIDTTKTYAISQFAGGDASKVGVLENGVVVDALDYLVYPADFTIWATNGATGTSDGTLNTGTGAAGGVAGTLTLKQYDKYDNSTSGLTATTQQAAIDESYAATLALSGKTIASGSATFTNSTNNIALTGIGVGVEVGDVISIAGSTNNSAEFTIEFITDNDNVVVNAAHAGKSRTVSPIGTKALIDETATVTVTLLCKWYLATAGLGQGEVDVTAERTSGVINTNDTNRSITASFYSTFAANTNINLSVSGIVVENQTVSSSGSVHSISYPVGRGADYIYTAVSGAIQRVTEIR